MLQVNRFKAQNMQKFKQDFALCASFRGSLTYFCRTTPLPAIYLSSTRNTKPIDVISTHRIGETDSFLRRVHSERVHSSDDRLDGTASSARRTQLPGVNETLRRRRRRRRCVTGGSVGGQSPLLPSSSTTSEDSVDNKDENR